MAAQLAQAISQATNKVHSAQIDGEITVTWTVKDPHVLDHGAEIFWQVRHSIPAPRAYEPAERLAPRPAHAIDLLTTAGLQRFR